MRFIVGVLCLAICFVQYVSARTVEFTIFTFNDVYDIHPKASGVGGFSNFYSILQEERKKAKKHITTMNGDFLFPSILSTFDKGKHRIELFNAMEVDYVVLGNHEFDFGPDIVKERIAESKFPWFGANVYDIDGNYFCGETQSSIIDIDGVKIGFFGIVTPDTPLLSSCENKVLFCPLALTAKRMCKELKEQGADVIVALTHVFISEDRLLAKEVPEIDIILGGHDHDPVVWYENDTLIMKVGQNAYFLGRIDLKMEVNESDQPDKKVKVFPSWKVVVNKEAMPHEKIQRLIEVYDGQLSEIGEKPLAEVVTSLDSKHSVVRSGESTMANLILDALREELSADCAIMSGGIIRGDRYYGPGTQITYQDLLLELAFDNRNILLKVKGRDIIKALENGFSQCDQLAGRFPQVSGLEVFFNPNNPAGERVIDVNINGKPLNTKQDYLLATNSYNAAGGDGFYSLCNGHIMVSPSEAGKLIDTVIKYLTLHPKITTKKTGRIRSIETLKTFN